MRRLPMIMERESLNAGYRIIKGAREAGMRRPNTIPLVNESILEPFTYAAQHIGTPIEPILRSVGLPTQLTGGAELLLPELPCWHFVQRVAKQEDIPAFGLFAAKMIPHQDLKSLSPLIGGCKILHELLKRFCRIAPTQSSINNYILREEEDFIWFEQQGIRLMAEDVQVQLFEVMGMIQLVQLAAGQQWHPPDIHLTCKHRADIENSEELGFSRIFFSQRYPAIAIPRQLLPLPLPTLSSPASVDWETPGSLAAMPDNFAGALRVTINSYLGNTDPKIELLAHAMDMNVRTFQRLLAQLGLSYTGILDQSRFQKAKILLEDTDIKLLDISLMLSYADAASFTRAFRRWSGVTPQTYRYCHSAG